MYLQINAFYVICDFYTYLYNYKWKINKIIIIFRNLIISSGRENFLSLNYVCTFSTPYELRIPYQFDCACN